MIEYFRTLHAKEQLRYAFKAAELYQQKSLSNGKYHYRYPKIHDVQITDSYTRYVFTLLNGINPKDVKKKEYVFQQVFGRNIELKGDLKRYVLYVYNKEMKSDVKYQTAMLSGLERHKLPILCGADRYGKMVSYDMTENPHILIGGRTGWGKSTQLRQLLTTLILTKTPDELEIYLGDAKKAEFHLFRNIAHVKTNVVQEKDIVNMVNYIKGELDERTNLLDVFEVEHIDKLPEDQRRPYIVLCVDEFVKLRKSEEIMDQLIDITSLGRALGIFVILSMQRPIAKIIDTTVRANLNVSMGFRVRDTTESRVLNTLGSEKLRVKGRFLMDVDGDLQELQAPLLTLEEAKRLLEPYRVAPPNVKEIIDEDSQEDNYPIFGGWGDYEEKR
ncbi:FtsK/SpoIIIE domain-containing protein [Bacillus gobiensis]|uniref:FtsK/SpoIIIE domain-containing protein n=1 Tax=Bacillus gobiensis TaxID=1441095 RepID=UPI003D2095AA